MYGGGMYGSSYGGGYGSSYGMGGMGMGGYGSSYGMGSGMMGSGMMGGGLGMGTGMNSALTNGQQQPGAKPADGQQPAVPEDTKEGLSASAVALSLRALVLLFEVGSQMAIMGMTMFMTYRQVQDVLSGKMQMGPDPFGGQGGSGPAPQAVETPKPAETQVAGKRGGGSMRTVLHLLLSIVLGMVLRAFIPKAYNQLQRILMGGENLSRRRAVVYGRESQQDHDQREDNGEEEAEEEEEEEEEEEGPTEELANCPLPTELEDSVAQELFAIVSEVHAAHEYDTATRASMVKKLSAHPRVRQLLGLPPVVRRHTAAWRGLRRFFGGVNVRFPGSVTVQQFWKEVKREKETEEECLAVALFPYDAQHEDELSFSECDRLVVLEQKPNGWWLAALQDSPDSRGLIPHNYVELLGRHKI